MAHDIEAFYAQFGERVSNMRTRRRWSQEDLGRRLDPPLTRASIANIESGKQRVLAHRVLQIAQALMVPVGALYEDTPPEQGPLPPPLHADEIVVMLQSAIPEMTNEAARRLALEILQGGACVPAG
jgi:transcriptional regulator with XRE-family HTH domain